MATVDSLHALLEEELKDIYDAEKQLTKALPKLAKKASSPDLKAGFEAHLRQTEEQIDRLEQVFESLEEKVKGKHCDGMAGIIEEGKTAMDEDFDEATMDACLIAAGQRAEHYEMAAYGCARTYARLLELTDDAKLLQQTLDEEGDTDHLLTDLAERVINVEALTGDREVGRGVERGGEGAAGSSSRRSRSTDSEART